MSKIVDPDQLAAGTEVVIDTTAKTIQLLVAGNLDDTSPGRDSGVTHQALYSFLKEEWLSDDSLRKFKFPIKAIYEAKFIWQNGWAFADDQSRDMIRDAGWQGINGHEYATIISLGDMVAEDTDQAYYAQVIGFDQTTANFDKTGPLNEPILIYDGVNDYRGYLKAFIREQAKTYGVYNLLVAQGYPSLTYAAYRLPLANDNDINVTASDNDIDTALPYTGMSIDFVKGQKYTTWAGVTGYVLTDVVLDPVDSRWYRCIAPHTSQVARTDDAVSWEAFPGERLIGTTYYAFNRIMAGNSGTLKQIYEYAQRQLRKTTDINANTGGDGYGTVYGNVAIDFTNFVGDILHSNPGVCIDNFDVNYTNEINMHDITVDGGGLNDEDVPVTSTARTFPYVAAGTMVFSTNLVNEVVAEYRMYFKNANGNQYDSANALVVNDKDGSPIQGLVSISNIVFSFDYDGNVQGGRTPGTDATVVLMGMGLDAAEWVDAEFTITRATGLSFPINAPDERVYSNP